MRTVHRSFLIYRTSLRFRFRRSAKEKARDARPAPAARPRLYSCCRSHIRFLRGLLTRKVRDRALDWRLFRSQKSPLRKRRGLLLKRRRVLLERGLVLRKHEKALLERGRPRFNKKGQPWLAPSGLIQVIAYTADPRSHPIATARSHRQWKQHSFHTEVSECRHF